MALSIELLIDVNPTGFVRKRLTTEPIPGWRGWLLCHCRVMVITERQYAFEYTVRDPYTLEQVDEFTAYEWRELSRVPAGDAAKYGVQMQGSPVS